MTTVVTSGKGIQYVQDKPPEHNQFELYQKVLEQAELSINPEYSQKSVMKDGHEGLNC